MVTSDEQDKWCSILDSWRSSGLSQAEFCRKQKITVSTFYYWSRKFSETKAKSAKVKTRSASVKENPAFVEITIPKADSQSKTKAQVFRITTSYGAVMEIPL